MKKQTNLIFVRHGETEFNKLNLYFGHLDPSLNEKGRMQLEKTKLKIEEKFDIIYCSELKRCRESLEILDISEEITRVFSSEFKEMNFGIFEGKKFSEIEKEYPEEVEKMKNDWKNFCVPKGESLKDLQDRVVEKVEEILKKHKNKTILIVTHAGVIKTIISNYLYGNLDGYWKINIDNGSLTKMCINEDNFIYFDYINRI